MAPGGEMFRYPPRFGENVLRHGSHEWLPYSKNAVRAKSSNTNLSVSLQKLPGKPFGFPGEFYSYTIWESGWVMAM